MAHSHSLVSIYEHTIHVGLNRVIPAIPVSSPLSSSVKDTGEKGRGTSARVLVVIMLSLAEEEGRGTPGN